MTEQLQLAVLAGLGEPEGHTVEPQTTPTPSGSPSPEAGLTERQRFALQVVRDAGADGVHADEVGAAWCCQRGKHPVDARCTFDGSSGNQVLRALRSKGLVKYRHGTPERPGHWIALDADGKPPARVYSGMLTDDEAIPF